MGLSGIYPSKVVTAAHPPHFHVDKNRSAEYVLDLKLVGVLQLISPEGPRRSGCGPHPLVAQQVARQAGLPGSLRWGPIPPTLNAPQRNSIKPSLFMATVVTPS